MSKRSTNLHNLPPQPSQHFSALYPILTSTTISNTLSTPQDSLLIGYTALINYLLSTNEDVILGYLETELGFYNEFNISSSLTFHTFDLAYDISNTTILTTLCIYFALSAIKTLEGQITRYEEQSMSDEELFKFSIPRYIMSTTTNTPPPSIQRLQQQSNHLRAALVMLLTTTMFNGEQQMRFGFFYNIYSLYLKNYLNQLPDDETPTTRPPHQDLFLPPLIHDGIEENSEKNRLISAQIDEKTTIIYDPNTLPILLRTLFTDHVTMDIINNQPLLFSTTISSQLNTCISFLSSQRIIASLPPLFYPQVKYWQSQSVQTEANLFYTFSPDSLAVSYPSNTDIPHSELIEKAYTPAPQQALFRLFKSSALTICQFYSYTTHFDKLVKSKITPVGYNPQNEKFDQNNANNTNNTNNLNNIGPSFSASRSAIRTLTQLLWYSFSRWHLPFSLHPYSIHTHYTLIKESYNILGLRRVECTPSLYNCLPDYVNIFKFLSLHLNLSLTRYPNIRHEYHSYGDTVKRNILYSNINPDPIDFIQQDNNQQNNNQQNNPPTTSPKYYQHFVPPNINNFTHDLSDGVIIALIINFYFPYLIPLSAIRYLTKYGHHAPITSPHSIPTYNNISSINNDRFNLSGTDLQESMGIVVINNFSLINNALLCLGSVPILLHPELSLNTLQYIYINYPSVKDINYQHNQNEFVSQNYHNHKLSSKLSQHPFESSILQKIKSASNRKIYTIFATPNKKLLIHNDEPRFSYPIELYEPGKIKPIDVISYGNDYTIQEQTSIIFLSFLIPRLIQLYPLVKATRRYEAVLEVRLLRRVLERKRLERVEFVKKRAVQLGLPIWINQKQLEDYEQNATIPLAPAHFIDVGQNDNFNFDDKNNNHNVEIEKNYQIEIGKIRTKIDQKNDQFRVQDDEFNTSIMNITGLNVSQVWQNDQGNLDAVLHQGDDEEDDDGDNFNQNNFQNNQNSDDSDNDDYNDINDGNYHDQSLEHAFDQDYLHKQGLNHNQNHQFQKNTQKNHNGNYLDDIDNSDNNDNQSSSLNLLSPYLQAELHMRNKQHDFQGDFDEENDQKIPQKIQNIKKQPEKSLKRVVLAAVLQYAAESLPNSVSATYTRNNDQNRQHFDQNFNPNFNPNSHQNQSPSTVDNIHVTPHFATNSPQLSDNNRRNNQNNLQNNHYPRPITPSPYQSTTTPQIPPHRRQNHDGSSYQQKTPFITPHISQNSKNREKNNENYNKNSPNFSNFSNFSTPYISPHNLPKNTPSGPFGLSQTKNGLRLSVTPSLRGHYSPNNQQAPFFSPQLDQTSQTHPIQRGHSPSTQNTQNTQNTHSSSPNFRGNFTAPNLTSIKGTQNSIDLDELWTQQANTRAKIKKSISLQSNIMPPNQSQYLHNLFQHRISPTLMPSSVQSFHQRYQHHLQYKNAR